MACWSQQHHALGFFQDVVGGNRRREILWQLPVQRVDLLATDVADY